MATKEEYTFQSANGVTTIHGVKWTPDVEPIAVIQLVHGMVEYIERYTAFAEFLASKGFVVVGHDHIGHGHSMKNLDEAGYMYDKHPSNIMVEDIYTNYKKTQPQYDGLPYFILGHSMGSYMLRKFLCVHGNDVDKLSGAIVMGTGTEADGAIKAGLTVINLLSKFKGENYRSTFVRDMTYGGPYKQYDCTGADPEKSWLSKNVENVKAYYKDPYCTFVFPLQAYRGLVESTGYDNKMENIQKMRKSLPIFFVSGACDPVGNMGKGVQEAHDKFIEAGMEDVEIKLYPNDRHEILNELDRETVYNDIYQWMLSKMV